VTPTLTPGTSRFVSSTSARSRSTASPFKLSCFACAVTRYIRPLPKVTYISRSASGPPPKSALTPGDGGLPGRCRLSRASFTMRSSAGSAPSMDSFSALASCLAVRNWRFRMVNSETRFVAREKCWMNGW
jgi:hypothetical protein